MISITVFKYDGKQLISKMLRQQVRTKSESTSQKLNMPATNHWLSEDLMVTWHDIGTVSIILGFKESL